MAGRTTKSRDGKPTASAVGDSELFPFKLDGVPPLEIKRGPEKKAASEKPHYHGHRERLRERFDAAGAEALADYELLELWLFRSIPRQDTKALAKSLIETFGDLAGVIAAPAGRLAKVKGVGPALAHDLKVAHALMQRAQRAEVKQRTVVSSWSQLLSYCRIAMAHEPREQFRVLFLDVKNQLIADEVMNEGTIDHAPVYPREIARRAMELSAASVILVHNHPSGDPKPSTQDIEITRQVVAAAKALDIRVHDHLVIGRNGVASFKSLGLL
ncbi:MAG: DNA repair protein RadC [Terricaulis sp.]